MSTTTGIYDITDGVFIHPSLKGITVPVPPKWVRDRTTLPPRYAYASLSEDLQTEETWRIINGIERAMAVEYVKRFTKRGAGKWFLALNDSWTKAIRAEFLAAGITNEIILRYGDQMDVSQGWLSVYGGVSYLLDMRDARRWDEYNTFRNNAMNCGLLWVQGLEGAKYNEAARWFVHMIYQHRYEQQLPILTTATIDHYDDLIKIYGRTFVERLWYESENYRLVLLDDDK